MKERVFIKGFDKGLKCRGYQFEVGKDYKIDLPDGYELTKDDLCTAKVFHFCDGLSKVHEFYSCDDEDHRFCIIEVLGQLCDDGKKCGSNHIRVVRELIGEELLIAKGLTNGNTGLFNSGYRNSGDRNSGVFNKTNGSNGVFCNIEPKICIFNIPTDWTLREFYKSQYWDAIYSSDFPLTEWIEEKDAPENGVDGKLKVNTYEDACRRWWDGMSKKNKKIIKSIPNFDIDVFCDITGIAKEKVTEV